MIYIWYNPKKQTYHLGRLKDFKKVKNALSDSKDFQLLYKFSEQKKWLANKILLRLNSSHQQEESTIQGNLALGITES